MPYQNNNNRLNPNAVGLTSINPVAEITNQLIKPQITIGEQYDVNKTRNIADTLKAIGEGTSSAIEFGNKIFNKLGEGTAEELILKDKIINNEQHEFKKAAEGIEGLNRFNPYVQINYKKLAAKDLHDSILNNFKSDSNLAYYEPDEFNQKMNAAMGQLKESLKAAKVPTSVAGEQLSSFYNNMMAMQGKYTIEHEAYKTELGYNQMAANYGKELYNNLMTGKKEEQYGIISNALNQVAELNPSIPEKVLYEKVLIPMITNTIKNADDFDYIDNEAILKVYEEFAVNKLGFDVFKPEMKAELKSSLRTIKRQKIQDIKEELEIKKLEDSKKADVLLKDWSTKLLNNEFNSPKEASEYITQKLLEAGISDEANSFLSYLKNYYSLSSSTNSILTPEMEDEWEDYLTKKQLMGELTEDVLMQAMNNKVPHNILRPYITSYFQEKKEEERQKRYENNQKSAEFKQDLKIESQAAKGSFKSFKILFEDKEIKNELQNKKAGIRGGKVISLWDEYTETKAAINQMIEGAKTPDELRDVQEAIERVSESFKRRLEAVEPKLPKNPSEAALYPEITNNWNKSYVDTKAENDSKIFTNSRLLGRGKEVLVKDGVKAGESPSYKIGMEYNEAIRMPYNKGTGRIVNAGYKEDSGYFMQVQFVNSGETMQIEGLKYFSVDTYKTGKLIQPNQIIGRSSGDINVRFINKDGNGWLTADKVLGVKKKK